MVDSQCCAAAGLAMYSPVFDAGFWTDDFTFVATAAQLALPSYLLQYFDPRMPDLSWYRPLQGIQWWVEYQFFGAFPTGYHVVNVAIHVANCILLLLLVARVTRKWWVGLIAAAALLSLPLIGMDVSWPGIADPLLTFFYLSTLGCWLIHLQTGRRWSYWLALVAFIAVLLTKEMGATILVVLFLLDRLLVNAPATWKELALRYLPMAMGFAIYGLIEYSVSQRGVYVNLVAYRASGQILANLWKYLQWLAFPWNLGAPLNQLALILTAVGLLYGIAIRRERAIIFLTLGGLIAVLPVLPFPFALERYAYLPLLASVVLAAVGFEFVRTRIRHPLWRAAIVPGVLVVAFLNNSATVFDNQQAYTGFVRATRLQFRPIFQSHATFAPDTLLYFIQPPFPTPNISGMMYLRYGANTYVYGTDRDRVSGLRNHNAAFMYYFDDENILREQPVAKDLNVQISAEFPIRFSDMISLDTIELADTKVKRGQAIVFVSYWRRLNKIDKDYTLFAHLIDKNGQIITGYDGQPKSGNAPTSSWQGNGVLADGVVVPIDSEISPGDYKLEIGWYDLASMERLMIMDARGQPATDKLVIEPIYVVE